MRILLILVVLLGSALFLKPSRFKKFFLIYALAIGTIGLLVYQGNYYVKKMSATRIHLSEITLKDFRIDRTLQLFLKGTIINNSPDATLKKIVLRITLYAKDSQNHSSKRILDTQDIKLFTRIGPGERKNIFQKLTLKKFEPSGTQQWDVQVISVRATLM